MTSKHSAARHLIEQGLFNGLSSFSELEARISSLKSTQEIGDAFEVFAEAYLTTQKIAQAQEVWPFKAIPMAQQDELSLNTGRDMGVDGTYLTVDGEMRAYQVKFRSRRVPLKWGRELSTFMGLTDQVSQRVLFTNSETLPSLMQDRRDFIPIRGSDLDRLTAEDFEAIRRWLQDGLVILPLKRPLPHQQEALTAIAKGLHESARATVVMACGTGKSLVSLWAAERFNPKTILVLVPSLALVRQLLHEWLRETAWKRLIFMCVCSDRTVANGADNMIVHQADLDFPVTTDSTVVARFINKPFDGVKIVFSTYQSAQVVAAGMPRGAYGKSEPFDLAIFDEAHKTASRVGTRFSFALEDTNIPIHKRLFFTATPRHYNILKKDKAGDNEMVYSMDRPEVYGQVIHTLSFAEAARRGIICDYKVVISVVTLKMVNDELLKHGEVIVNGDVVDARLVAIQIALQKAVEKYGLSRIFTFHNSVAAARSFTSADGKGITQHLPGFTTLHVSGAMPTSQREKQMKAFRDAPKAVISNARCLTEGVDVPAVDMVAFISPRKSRVDIVQATGRAMRKSPGKEFGYVMVPLFVEQANGESIDDALQRTGFDAVWELLGAMKEQDDVLADIIQEMRIGKGRTGSYDTNQFSDHIEMLGPVLSLESIRESVTTACVEELAENWDERYGELLAYIDLKGDPNFPRNFSNPQLSNWVFTQRQRKKGAANLRPLSKKQIDLLDKIGFYWGSDEDDLTPIWLEGYQQLIEYKQAKRHTNVPKRKKGESGKLSAWVSAQRQAFAANNLSEARTNALNKIGFNFQMRVRQTWERRHIELVAYFKKYCNFNVPTDYSEAPKLRQHIALTRYQKRQGKLSAERIIQLDSIGFVW